MSQLQLTNAIMSVAGWGFNKVNEMLSSGSATYSQPQPGSKWVTVLDGKWLSHDGILLSAFYHPTKMHTASTIGKNGTKRSTAKAGQWAISYQTRGAFGNKAYYNISQ